MTALALLPAPATRPPLSSPAPVPVFPPAQAPLPFDAIDLPGGGDPGVPEEVSRPARAIGRALAEVVAGHRPVSQVRPVLAPRVAHLLDHLIRAEVARGLRLTGLRVQSPVADAAEASLRLTGAAGGGAMALRLERRGRRWAVTALEAAFGPDARRPARS